MCASLPTKVDIHVEKLVAYCQSKNISFLDLCGGKSSELVHNTESNKNEDTCDNLIHVFLQQGIPLFDMKYAGYFVIFIYYLLFFPFLFLSLQYVTCTCRYIICIF